MAPRRALALGFIAIVLIALPASAGGKPHLQTVKFRATLEATEAVSWSLNTSTVCGTQTGSGRQSRKFHQAGKLTLLLSRQLGGTRLLMVSVGGARSNLIPIVGEWTRTGKVASSSSGKCGTGTPEGPAEAPPQPDCGSKHFKGTISANWSPAASYPGLPEEPTPLVPQFWLDEPYSSTTFKVCPFFGPLVIFRATHAGLTEKTVFSALPKLTVSDKVKKVSGTSELGEGIKAETTVAWKLRLTRVSG